MGKDVEERGERIAELAAHLDAAKHRLLTELRAFDEAGGHWQQGFRTCGEWLSWRVGWGSSAAREHVRVAKRLAELPLIDDALRRGELSYCKVRAITRVATPANEATLLEDARFATGSQLEKICSKYAAVVRGTEQPDERGDRLRRYVTRTDLADGMVRLTITMHRDEAELVQAALNKVAAERYRAERVTAPVATGADGQSAGDATAASGDTAVTASPETVASEASTATATTATATATTAAPTATARSATTTATTATTATAATAATAGTSAAEAATAATRDTTAAADTTADAAITTTAACSTASNAVAAPDSASSAGTPVAAATATALAAAPAAPDGPHARAATVERRPTFCRVDALVAMAQDVLRGTSPRRSPTELVVTVEAEVLLHPHDAADPIGTTADGTAISAESVRRLGCDCGVVHVREDDRGNLLSVGRKTRSIPVSIKRALLQRDRMCRFPGCGNRLFLEGHHIHHWADGGETSLRNMVATCSFHHRFLHEYGYRVELDTDQQPRFFTPDGQRVPDLPPPTCTADLGWPALEALNEELDISAETACCGWDGQRVDYGLVIDDLVRADRLQ